jgi:putative CocE/NonD family hydrolase
MTTTATTSAPPFTMLPKVPVRMRDAVDLCTDVYLPAVTPCAAIVVRTPYGRQVPFLLMLVRRLTQAGFAVVLQDSRGRYQSGGSFDWQREPEDSEDTLTWLGAQRWASGDVGLIGISITGCANFLVASRPAPPGVRIGALVSIVAITDYYSLFYRNGALVQHWALPVSMMMSSPTLSLPLVEWREVFNYLPLTTTPTASGHHAGLWQRTLAHPTNDEFWQAVTAEPSLDRLRTPVLHLTGWYDFLLGQTLRTYRRIGRGTQHLVIGPWDHRTIFASFSGAARDEAAHLMNHVLDWFDRWLRDGAAADLHSPRAAEPVQVFVMEEGVWLGADSFPLPETVFENWYLSSSGAANSASGDGRLDRRCPTETRHDSFTYDPRHPVPTVGGAIWHFPPANLTAGPADQRAIEARDDVLVYTSEPLATDLIVVGPIAVELWASTSAVDTDFTAKLVDVDGDGHARIVQDGIVRARAAFEPGTFEPDRPYRFDIDLQAAGRSFKAGHSLRVEIASSNFPKFDRNLNAAAPFGTAEEAVVARQRVFHGGAMASCLRLPVIPREAAMARVRPAPAGTHGA